jgi:hypothetical protein
VIGELDESSFLRFRWWMVPIIITGVVIGLNKISREVQKLMK